MLAGVKAVSMETHHPGRSRPLGSPDVARKFLESRSVPAPRGKVCLKEALDIGHLKLSMSPFLEL